MFSKLLSLLTVSTIVAAKTAILFPMYIYPFHDTVCGGWTPVINSIKAHPNLPFYLVINPDSGPGVQPLNSDWTPCIPQLRSASSNVKVIGYVHTNRGSQPQSAVMANVSIYAGWDTSYRPDGIFFDEAATDANNVSYYQSLASQTRTALGSSAPIILNPGSKADPGYYPFSTFVVTREDFYNSFSLDQLSFDSSTPASKQAVLLHHGPTTTNATLVNTLVGVDKIGALFLTSEEYASVPTDWDNFVNLVDAAA